MMTVNDRPINCQLNEEQQNFFEETVGSIYLIGGKEGYSFFEGYVIDAFLVLFEDQLGEFNLMSALNLLKTINGQEGK